MRLYWADRSGNPRLILIFSGWGADPALFGGITKPGCDIAVANDYRDLNLDSDVQFAGYEEIVVVAWSFGVVVADRTDFGSLPITLRLAVNGTTHHVDDRLGIPQAIFRGTLANLDERNLLKFSRRMCGNPRMGVGMRPLDEVLPELEAFARIVPGAPRSRWDRAVVSLGDAIFPPANQTGAWEGVAATDTIDGPHLPDFQEIINRYVKDKQLVAQKFGATQHTYTDQATAQRRVARRLWDLWEERVDYTTLSSALEVGCGDGTFTRIYAPELRVGVLTLWDIADCSLEGIDRCFVFNRCDAETAIRRMPSGSVDLLLSSSTLQWMNSPAAFLSEALRALKPGGHCLLSVYAAGTFAELAEVTGLSLDYPTASDLKNMTRGYNIVATATEEIALKFASPREALAHIRATGVNALRRQPLGVASMRRALANYPLDAEGRATITFRPVYLILEKPI